MHVEFSQKNCPRFIKAFDDGGVFVRDKIGQNFRAAGGTDAFRPEQILKRNRNAMQRAKIFSGNDSLLSFEG